MGRQEIAADQLAFWKYAMLCLRAAAAAGSTTRCRVERHRSLVQRAINYPARDTAPLPGQFRAGAHTDYGTLTILRQDAVGGLEVLGPGGRWVSVEPVPGAFVVNIGDLMARWTNDRWRSTLHRVVDPAAAAARRQSMPYFQNANWSAAVSCLPTCLQPGEKPRYEPVLAGPHLMGKFRRSVSL